MSNSINSPEGIIDEPRTLFLVPEVNYAKFQNEIKKLSRKSERLGYGAITPWTIGYQFVDLKGGNSKVKCFEVYFTDTMVKIDGWRFVATLDHSQETGNLIRSLPNTPDLPVQYRTSKPVCDHCNVNRYRRDTYVLQCEETGEFKQIGRSCMKDFFGGHDPQKLIKRAEMLGFATECARGYSNLVGVDHRFIELAPYLAQVARQVRVNGYVTRKMVQDDPSLVSTASDAFYFNRETSPEEFHPTSEDIAVAEAAQEWAADLKDQPNLDEYLSNISVLGGSTHIEMRHMALAASIVGVWMRRQKQAADRAQQAALRAATGRPSQHVGVVGDRLRDVPVTVTSIFVKERPDTYTLVIVKFLSTEGDEFVWFPTTNFTVKEGDQVSLTGTVKSHGNFKGALNTVLTRCTIGPRKAAAATTPARANRVASGGTRGNGPVEARAA